MKKIFILSLLAMVFFSCSKGRYNEPTPNVKPDPNPGVTPKFNPEIIIPQNIISGTGVALEVKKTEPKNGELTAKVLETKATAGSYRISVVNSDILLYASEPGEYVIEISQGSESVKKTIKVQPNEKKTTKYITRVLEYLPAPGQFVNQLPEYEDGDTQEIMNRKALEAIGGINRDKDMISLGAWGGYVIFGFDHSVQNVEGKADLCIEGNAFVANSIGDNLGSKEIMEGSVEPGVVMVSYDKNNNGLADDEWFEILGSGSLTLENESWYSFMKTKYPDIDLTIHRDYEMTYYRPKSEKPQDPNKYIEWSDNKNKKDFMPRNKYHEQPYYPLWIKSDKMTFKGVRLANNMYRQNSGEGFYLQLAYKYGYVDNVPNNHKNNNIDISWAVDKNGKKVKLPYIDFVKVQTGVYGVTHSNSIGEISTEVLRAMDLHIAPATDINSSEIVK